MKSILIFLVLFVSCTQKYKTYHAIDKSNFEFDKPHNPILTKKVRGKKEVQQSCEGQILFNRNAQKIVYGNIPAMVQYSCPGQRYLMDVKFTETWWTTLIYTRSCLKLEAYCPRK